MFGLVAKGILIFTVLQSYHAGVTEATFTSTPLNPSHFKPSENVSLTWTLDPSVSPVVIIISKYNPSRSAYDEILNYIIPTKQLIVFLPAHQKRIDMNGIVVLRINNTITADAGRYKCQVNTNSGPLESVVELLVEAELKTTIKPSSSSASERSITVTSATAYKVSSLVRTSSAVSITSMPSTKTSPDIKSSILQLVEMYSTSHSLKYTTSIPRNITSNTLWSSVTPVGKSSFWLSMHHSSSTQDTLIAQEKPVSWAHTIISNASEVMVTKTVSSTISSSASALSNNNSKQFPRLHTKSIDTSLQPSSITLVPRQGNSGENSTGQVKVIGLAVGIPAAVFVLVAVVVAVVIIKRKMGNARLSPSPTLD